METFTQCLSTRYAQQELGATVPNIINTDVKVLLQTLKSGDDLKVSLPSICAGVIEYSMQCHSMMIELLTALV